MSIVHSSTADHCAIRPPLSDASIPDSFVPEKALGIRRQHRSKRRGSCTHKTAGCERNLPAAQWQPYIQLHMPPPVVARKMRSLLRGEYVALRQCARDVCQDAVCLRNAEKADKQRPQSATQLNNSQRQVSVAKICTRCRPTKQAIARPRQAANHSRQRYHDAYNGQNELKRLQREHV